MMASRVALLTALLAGTALAAHPVKNRIGAWKGFAPDDPGAVGKTGGYMRPPSVEFWTDKPAEERAAPPYSPPKDWVYNTGGGPVEGKINVHLVPHTHDDTGWQVTVDQYFFQDVYYVVDTVVDQLLRDANRRFMYVEVGFFARWWDQQPEARKNETRMLVNEGRLEFINGGWCMHDEASPFYVEMVDQTTRGHQFLKKNFGNPSKSGKDGVPRGTWQIDPFGHSNTNAWLTSAEAGMESLFWGRTDYQDFDVRKNTSRLEWIWQGSKSLGSSAQVFAGELYGGGGGGYGTWIGFDGTNDQVQDDPSRHDYNVDQWVDKFVQDAVSQAAHTKTDHQMWACGSDFQYQDATHWYRNLDKLIHYINQNATVNAFYSTPTFYVDHKKKAGMPWEVRQDDIFPLADAAHNYWTGYFTSRPALKRQVRFASNFLNAARQMEVISKTTAAEVDVPTVRPSPPVGSSWTDSLEGTIGVATHHDGMSGTERQDVANDYEQRISESHIEVEAGVALSLKKLIPGLGDLDHCNCNVQGNCLNISVCGATTGKDSFSVVAWNPRGQATSQYVRIPVVGADGWTVTALNDNSAVAAQTLALDNRTLGLPLLYINSYKMNAAALAKAEADLTNKATHILTFEMTLPAVGYASVSVTRKSSAVRKLATVAAVAAVAAPSTRAPVTSVSNDMYELKFSPTTGELASITNKVSGVTTPMSITWGWYNSSVGGCTKGLDPSWLDSCSGQQSGAYMFRPNSSTFFYPGPKGSVQTEVVEGPIVTEVRQVYSEWVTHVIRLQKNSPYIEVEYTAGPIPVATPWFPAVAKGKDNVWGKELVIRYSTDMKTDGTFYTDSNGLEMVKRVFNKRGPSYPPLNVSEPIAGNYYPVNAMIGVEDKTADTSLVVMTDVSQGGSSLVDGQVELMVHRRVQSDDSRGVQEPLNETMCGCNDIGAKPGQMGAHGHEGDGGCTCAGLTMRGSHLLIFDKTVAANGLRRQVEDRLNFKPTLAFGAAPKVAGGDLFNASFLGAELPANIKIHTLTSNYAEINDGAILLRLAHMYSVGEHPTLSQPATVSLAEVFSKAQLKVR